MYGVVCVGAHTGTRRRAVLRVACAREFDPDSLVPPERGGTLHPALRERLAELDEDDRAVIATEPDGRVLYWSPGAEQLYGWTAEEALGRDIVELTPGDLSRAEAGDIMSALNRGERWAGEFLVQSKSGVLFTVHVIDIPVTAPDGGLVGIIGISRRVAYLR